MIDPFTSWSRLAAISFDLQRNWMRAAETLQASGNVISARTDIMRDAMSAPLDADYPELARMVPEKIAAFGLSGQAIFAGMMKLQTAYWTQAQQLTMMMLAGNRSSPSRLMSRAHRDGLAALETTMRMGRGALAPIHKTSTANARRLRSTGPKRPIR